MKWLRAPLQLVFLGSACSLFAPDDDFFDGGAFPMGGRTSGGSATSGGTPDPGAGHGGTGGSAGMTGASGDAGASSGGTGGINGTGGSVGTGSSGGASGGNDTTEGGRSGDGGSGATSGGGAGGGGGASDSCGLPASKSETEACGACNTGKRERTLTLNDDCSYTIGAWGECMNAVANPCTPNAVDPGEQNCGACNTGKQTRSRICSPTTCTWGEWTPWSACTGVTAACTPNDTSPCANGDSCGHRVCSASCTWGACTPRVAGTCLRIRSGHTDEGSNYRCCATGKWQFCLSSCQWSTACAACSQGSPDYCSDCY